ncbi:alpha-L-fucosidase [Sphingomonas endophytica]|uniref:alpha-L-fucosidase n=1 Tax=Sphingomonas endophytica TaxID=869719 RepID=A0ABR6N519_9SPHN|nr:alpha-L-fucosidase [Sphingomonas endophytica]MBB5725619.1 alpha-L-fucosidase [Sphingomonas endophytica]
MDSARRRLWQGLTLAIAAALAVSPAAAQSPDAYTPAPANLAARKWFQDAKFGIFLHWGLYSELGGTGSSGGAEWIMQDNKIPAAKYERLAKFFYPQKFDADAWVRSFKDAGARYIVITSKHHDGFAMFDSKVSPYNVVQATPFKRDPIGELAAACRRQGVKLFFYYSQLDWHHPDYFPRGRTGHSAGRPEAGDWDKYLDYQDAQLRELLTQYGPIGGIWFDGWWDQEKTPLRDRWRLERTYRLIHQLQPGALIVNNHHHAPFAGEDYQTFERDLPGENKTGFSGTATIGRLPLETAETMNGSWGFNLTDDQYKSPKTLVQTLVGAAGRNANFLLNTGPMPNGEIQPENLATFRTIGDWLKVNGVSIYGTRGGPLSPGEWGVTTQKGKTVYVHLLRAHDGRIVLPLQAPVAAARLLDGGARIAVARRGDGVEITGLPPLGDSWDQVIELTLR